MSPDPAPVPAGALLVATPELLDPNFSRAVVLVLASNAEGALGLVVNRATQVPLTDVLPEWTGPSTDPQVVFVGGPVSPSGAIALGLMSPARDPGSGPSAPSADRPNRRPAPEPPVEPPLVNEPRLFGGRLGTVDLSVHEDGAAGQTGATGPSGPTAEGTAALQSVRVFAGYAGWGAQQLDAEIATGSWFVVPALPDDPFDPDPATLWRRVLRRQGPPLALVSTFPEDARQN